MKNFSALVALLSFLSLAPLTQAQEDPNAAAQGQAPAAPAEGSVVDSQQPQAPGAEPVQQTAPSKRASRKAKHAGKKAKHAAKKHKKAAKRAKRRHGA